MNTTDAEKSQKIVQGLITRQLTIHNVIRRTFKKIAKFDIRDEQAKGICRFKSLLYGACTWTS